MSDKATTEKGELSKKVVEEFAKATKEDRKPNKVAIRAYEESKRRL